MKATSTEMLGYLLAFIQSQDERELDDLPDYLYKFVTGHERRKDYAAH